MSLTILQLTTICMGIYSIITLGMRTHYNNSYTYDGLIGDKTLKLLKGNNYAIEDMVEFEFNDISFDYEICEE